MTNETFHLIQIVLSVLAACSLALLAFMFWNASLTSGSKFTKSFLQILSISSLLKVLEIVSACYRISQISAVAVPHGAYIVSIAGRGIELAGYLIMVWFLLRPDTRKSLNGGG